MRGHLNAAKANLDTDEKDWKVEGRKGPRQEGGDHAWEKPQEGQMH